MAADPPTLDSTTFARLNAVSTATLTTQLFRRGFRTRFIHGVRPLRTGTRLLGQARTLRYVPAREDLDTLDTLGSKTNAQRKLIEDVRPGQVVVIDAMRDTRAGSLGSILALRIQRRGAAGIVTDGAYRDTPAIKQLGIPAYAAASNANTNLTIYHPTDIDVPIGCGGVMVEPGDTVVGDDEGVIVIPALLTAEVARDAYAQEVKESFIHQLVQGGANVFDVYPLGRPAQAQYEAWRRQRDPDPLLDEPQDKA